MAVYDALAQSEAPCAVADWSDIYERLGRDPNDSAAFLALTERIRGWVRTRMPSLFGAACREDVVADTCSSVIVNLRDGNGADTFRNFVFGHYLNARRRHLQHRWFTVPLETIDPPEVSATRPDPDEISLLRRCLADLPERDRKAVELRYLHDATTREIAEALGVTEVNARQIVFYGLSRLRRRARVYWPLGRVQAL